MTITDNPRQHIIDALVERGYGILEVTWVTERAGYLSFGGGRDSGYWAATVRNPVTGEIKIATGAFLGAILASIANLPDPVAAVASDTLPAPVEEATR